MMRCWEICGLRTHITDPREFTVLVHFLTHIGKKLNHKLCAKFTFVSILELDGLIKSHRAAPKDGIVLFMLSKKYTGTGKEKHDYQWMELTNLAHPSELPRKLTVYIANHSGRAPDCDQRFLNFKGWFVIQASHGTHSPEECLAQQSTVFSLRICCMRVQHLWACNLCVIFFFVHVMQSMQYLNQQSACS